MRPPIDDFEVEMLKADLEKLADHTLTGNEAYEVLRLWRCADRRRSWRLSRDCWGKSRA